MTALTVSRGILLKWVTVVSLQFCRLVVYDCKLHAKIRVNQLHSSQLKFPLYASLLPIQLGLSANRPQFTLNPALFCKKINNLSWFNLGYSLVWIHSVSSSSLCSAYCHSAIKKNCNIMALGPTFLVCHL